MNDHHAHHHHDHDNDHHDHGHEHHHHEHDHAHHGHGEGHHHHHHEPLHPDSHEGPLDTVDLIALESLVYRFPQNKQAKTALDFRQIKKVQECASKLEDAYSEDDTTRWIVEQAWDVIQAAEGVLRKCSDEEVLRGYAAVMQKCHRRGDFE